VKVWPKTDVVIMGLGAAGGVAADVLTAAGLNVVGLEAGDRLSSQDFVRQLDEIAGWTVRNALGRLKVNGETPSWRRDLNQPAIPAPGASPMMNALGGASVHYSAASWRFRPDDFRVRSETVARYGEQALPSQSAVADWPITYSELEPYYDRVEYGIGVSGQAGANPFEGPRSRDYPMPPLRTAGIGALAAHAMKSLGYHPFPQPAAINSVPRDGRAACSYCGFCSGFGCWNDSKSSTLVTSLARAEATGRLAARTRCRVTRIAVSDKGEVSGVDYVDADGTPCSQPADFVILSGFVYENVRRLLLSRSERFPSGLGNAHGQVGKYYLAHTTITAAGYFPGTELNIYGGTQAQSVAIDDLNGDHFDHRDLGFIRGALITVNAERLPIGAAELRPPDVPAWGPKYKAWLKSGPRSTAALTAQLETLPYEGNFMDLDPVGVDERGEPRIRITYDIHENERRASKFFADKLELILQRMGAKQTWVVPRAEVAPVRTHCYGGTRMGSDPRTSVVDAHGLVHECRNVAILGGSTFVSCSGYNPTQTIQALSWRSAEYIAANFAAWKR
jgi:gluconate 2-dehydrogenase alpha chain